MKQIDFDRAFGPTPACVTQSIQDAFAKGEAKMKLQTKFAGLLAVAAALAIVLAVAALASGQLNQPQPDVLSPGQPQSTAMPQADDERIAYCTPGGNFYHYDATCSGMTGAEKHALSNAIAAGKQPCPVCVPEINPVTTPEATAAPAYTTAPPETNPADAQPAAVYYTPGGTFFHIDTNCSGMMNAETHDLYDALLAGKKVCPVCLNDAELFLPGNLEGLHIDLNVYCTESGSHYHLTGSCSAMDPAAENPVALTQADAIAKGKDGCPACLNFFSSESGDAVAWYVPGEYMMHSHSHAPDGSRPISIRAAYNVGMQFCSECSGREYTPSAESDTAQAESAVVYFTLNGNYFHLVEDCSGMQNAEGHSVDEAIGSTKRHCPVCISTPEQQEIYKLPVPGNDSDLVYIAATNNYYHRDPECFDMHIPIKVSRNEAREKNIESCPNCLGDNSAAADTYIAMVKKADSEASKAEDFFVYTAADSESAWVFCRFRSDVYHEGIFWHVRDGKATRLAAGNQIWDWFYHTEVEPGIFVYSIGEGDERRAHAAILKDGEPYLLEGAGAFANLQFSHGRLYGMTFQDYDYCFLEIADNQLREVEALPLATEDFLKMDGADEVMNAAALYDPSCELTSCLQRPNGVITLNLFSHDRSETEHCYIYTTKDGFAYDRGWGDELAMLPGEGSPGGMRYSRS